MPSNKHITYHVKMMPKDVGELLTRLLKNPNLIIVANTESHTVSSMQTHFCDSFFDVLDDPNFIPQPVDSETICRAAHRKLIVIQENPPEQCYQNKLYQLSDLGRKVALVLTITQELEPS